MQGEGGQLARPGRQGGGRSSAAGMNYSDGVWSATTSTSTSSQSLLRLRGIDTSNQPPPARLQ